MNNPKLETGRLGLDAEWGPFSTVYLGISHVLDRKLGTMADLALFAGRVAPREVVLPDNIFGYGQNVVTGDRRVSVRAVPEKVALDYSAFSIRYYLDQHGDTALASFKVESGSQARCDVTFYNSSAEERSYFFGLGLMAQDSRHRIRLRKDLLPWWVPARQYSAIEAYQKVFGIGCRQCLTRVFSWGVEEQVLAQAFGGWEGDCVKYRVKLPGAIRDGYVYFRYVKYGAVNHPWEIRINGRPVTFSFPQTWAIPGGGWGKNRDACEEWRLLGVKVGHIPAGETNIELRPVNPPGNDRARIWLDGMLFSEGRLPGDDGAADLLPTTLTDEYSADVARVDLESIAENTAGMKVIVPGAPEEGVTVKIRDVPLKARAGKGSFLSDLRSRFELPPLAAERDASVLPWVGLDSDHITVPARSDRTVSLEITFGSGVAGNRPKIAAPGMPEPPRGPYADLAARLRDALLFNVNYPFDISGGPSHYFVPSKYFPLPYSWDGGFIAVGLATYAPELARRQTAYFLADENTESPFIYCGSPVPTQLYALWDIYQATQDKEFLGRIYSGARRMYDFYLGRTPGSIVNEHGDGMLSTYPYNYNLGIDDHPIQRWAEEQHLTRKGLYSIILMPQILRAARIMRNAAWLLGLEADAGQYGQDVSLLADIIDRRMWDEQSGLYGWLFRAGQGVEPVRMDGCAGDRSACAFLPLFAGQTARKERLIGQMTDTARFKTPHGISSVDMSAPSYNPRGYWNGAIWPVMQWYLWRGLLEAGEADLARQVAESILGTWQKSLEKEHYLGEHFVIDKALMNGAPNFGGLSGALLPMQAAYYEPYRVTTPYDVIIERLSADRVRDALVLEVAAPFLGVSAYDLLVNMGRGSARYAVDLNGKRNGIYVSDECGHLALRLPQPAGKDEVRIQPAGLGES